NLQHLIRALASEQHEAGEAGRIESERRSFGGAVDLRQRVKARMQNHSRRFPNAVIGMAHLLRLLGGAIGTADEELPLTFNPKVRRIIGDISQESNKRPVGERAGETPAQSAI